MAVGDAYVFPGFLTPVLTQLFFPKPPTTFLTCLCRGERRKYAGKKSHLNRGSNSQPPGHESNTLTIEPPGQGSSQFNPLPDNKILDWSNLKNSLQTTILNLMKIAESSLNGYKTPWVKEKLLVTSNFSFSLSVFKGLASQGRQMVSLCGKGLTLYHTIPTFNDPKEESFGKHCWKRRKCW